MADNIAFALSVGRQVRSQHGPHLDPGEPRVLLCTWDGATTNHTDVLVDRSEAGKETTLAEAAHKDREAEVLPVRKERLSCLYRRELTIKKDWSVVLKAGEAIACRVVLSDLADTDDWYAPWYVFDDPPPLHPVNVLFDELQEAAAEDAISDQPGLDRFPQPIRHGRLPRGMRTRAITNLRDLLRRQEIATVCVLVYDVRTESGQVKRLVLDGNHRLAAARALAQERAQEGRRGWRRGRRQDAVTDVRVLAFVMSEPDCEPEKWKMLKERVDVRTSDPEGSFPDWRGFSPDIGLVRGTWTPERYQRWLDQHR
jgi:hypothetical protein